MSFLITKEASANHPFYSHNQFSGKWGEDKFSLQRERIFLLPSLLEKIKLVKRGGYLTPNVDREHLSKLLQFSTVKFTQPSGWLGRIVTPIHRQEIYHLKIIIH